jgi:ATP-dependent Clp protease protease subunit
MDDPRESDRNDGPLEISLVGDLTENELDLTDKLLSVPPGGECVLYIDSPGGSPYCALALVTLLRLRGIRATGVVTGECSSAALWPFAACTRRLVTPYSVLLFHAMKWQSEEHVGLSEAAEWARHFAQLERSMDKFLADLFGIAEAKVAQWVAAGKYVTGPEIVQAGLAEMIDLRQPGLQLVKGPSPAARPRKDRGLGRPSKHVAHSGKRPRQGRQHRG